MSIIEVDRLAKTFRIPSVRRDTFREHVFDLFRPYSHASGKGLMVNIFVLTLRQSSDRHDCQLSQPRVQFGAIAQSVAEIQQTAQ